MEIHQFISRVTDIARNEGYPVALNRNGQDQIDFGHKKLHSGHLVQLFPRILEPGVNISILIESVAPGRPCSHRPMKEIIQKIQVQI